MHTKTLLLAATVLTLGAGAAFASEGQYASPYTGEPTELPPAFPDVISVPAPAPTAGTNATHVYTATHGEYTTDPATMRMLFPEQVNQN